MPWRCGFGSKFGFVRFCSVCSVLKIGGAEEKDLVFDGGRIFNKKYVCLLKNSCIY